MTGSWRGLFDGPSTVRPGGHLVVYSLRDLAEELRPLGTLLTLARQVAPGRARGALSASGAWELSAAVRKPSPHSGRHLARRGR